MIRLQAFHACPTERQHAIRAAMLADAQGAPEEKELTHALFDAQGNVWGGFCASYAPVVMLWLNGQRTGPEAMLAKHRAIVAVERFYAAQGHTRILLTLHRDSALYPYAERGGYQLLGACELFAKDLSQPNPLQPHSHVRPILKAQSPASGERASGER